MKVLDYERAEVRAYVLTVDSGRTLGGGSLQDGEDEGDLSLVRTAELVVKVSLNAILRDRRQQTPNGGQVLLPKYPKLAQQLRRTPDVREILVPVWKSQPVIARKGDARSCRGGRPVVLEG